MENIYKFEIFDGRVFDTNSKEILLLIPELTKKNVNLVKSVVKPKSKMTKFEKISHIFSFDVPIEEKIIYITNATDINHAFAYEIATEKVYKVKYWEKIKNKVKEKSSI